MSTKLILIRHGETDLNAQKRYCGFLDKNINARGRNQAYRLAQRLKKEDIDKLYSSDRKRALVTAGIVFKRKKAIKVRGLREMNFGIFEGLTYKQIMKRYPLVYKQWLKDPYSLIIPRGEGLNGFQKRTVAAINKIVAANKDKTIAIVAHGGVVSAFINHILKARDFWKYVCKSSSLTIIEYIKGKPKIKLFNDTKHLTR